MVERLLREVMVGKRWEVPRLVLAVEVRGHYPSAQLVVTFRDDLGRGEGEGEAEWELWDEGSMIGGRWEAPSDMASAISATWPRPPVERWLDR
jgi:hypothetical protein